jgi:DNA-binding NarL/FixJ family response regulator
MAEVRDVVRLNPLTAEQAPPRWQILIRQQERAPGKRGGRADTTASVLVITPGEAPEHLAPTLRSRLANPGTLPTPATGPPRPHLTERQLQVLHGLDRGLCDKEIAQDLGIAVSTVKSHARAIYEKLEVGSRTAAVHAARERGMI